MLRHCVMFRWKDGTGEDQVAAIRDALVGLPALIPEISAYTVGADLGLRDGNYDFAVVADFQDEAAFRAYAANPDHVELISELIAPVAATRISVQFTV